MKTLMHPNYVNAFKNILTLHTIELIKDEKRKSKNANFIQRVVFNITIHKPSIFQYHLYFIHRLVFDAGIPVYYVATPSLNISLTEKSYHDLLAKMYERTIKT